MATSMATAMMEDIQRFADVRLATWFRRLPEPTPFRAEREGFRYSQYYTSVPPRGIIQPAYANRKSITRIPHPDTRASQPGRRK
jgi:hypothetical protein